MSAQMIPNLDELLRVLNAATDKKALRWTETASEDTFRAQFGYGLVRIARDADPAGSVITLVDREGTVLSEYDASTSGETRAAFEDLYTKARQQALHLDEKLKVFFDHLKALVEAPHLDRPLCEN